MSLNGCDCASIEGQQTADYVDWSNVFSPNVLTWLGNSSYLDVATVHGRQIRIVHPVTFQATWQGTGPTDWNGDFTLRDSLLSTDSDAGPISFIFDPPVRCVGAHVQANVRTAATYVVQLRAFSGQGNNLSIRATGATRHLGQGDAPFLGVQSDQADITRAEFHVMRPARSAASSLAIDRLRFA